MNISQDQIIEIIAVGEELLTPFFLDTNSLFITEKLNDLGLSVRFKTIVGDQWNDLHTAIHTAVERAHIIIATGGLGPTQDDRTREAFASVLGLKLIFHEDLRDHIESRFKKRGIVMPEVNKRQDYTLEGSEVLRNSRGTAPGLLADIGEKTIVLLPGPPHELEPMFMENVRPRLLPKRRFFTSRKVFKIVGMTESRIESLIYDLYPKHGDAALTPLARPGQIEIHLSARSSDSEEAAGSEIERISTDLRTRLGSAIISEAGQDLEEVVGRLLLENRRTLAVAESCTGGFLGNRITNIPGSSAYFSGGILAYSNQVKTALLEVPESLLAAHGAVSAETAEAMSSGVKRCCGTDYGLAVTGIAGPGGETDDKPVGLVFTALSGPGGTVSLRNLFLGNRANIKFQSSQQALEMLRRDLLGLKMPQGLDKAAK